MEAINKTLTHVLVNHGVASDVVFPLSLFCGSGKFAVQQKVCHFEVRRTLGELLDGITAVAKNARLTVKVGDC